MDNQTETNLTVKDAPRSLKSFKKHRENPFIKSLAEYKVSKKRTVVKGGKAIIDIESGEYENTAEITTVRSVDAEQFVKLYTTRLKDIFSLKPTSMKVLQVLLDQIQKTAIGGDQVMLNYAVAERYFEENELKSISKSSFYTAIAEMVAKGFIAQADVSSNLFFINPHLFFNGDRVKFVEEWHIDRRKDLFKDQRILEGKPEV